MSFMHFHPQWLCNPTPKPTGEKLAKCLEKTNKLQNAVSFFQSKFLSIFVWNLAPGGCERCNTFYLSVQFSRGIQQLRGQNFAIFWPPPPCVDSFFTLRGDKNRNFLTPLDFGLNCQNISIIKGALFLSKV